jgi:hypothetical protein
MKKLVLVALGIMIGLALPFLIDWVMFGNITPCHTVKQYEDGSTLLGCNVRG